MPPPLPIRRSNPCEAPLCALLLAVVLVPAASAQFGDPLPGEYVNTSNKGRCVVHRDGRGYVFTNENGDNARFEFVAF